MNLDYADAVKKIGVPSSGDSDAELGSTMTELLYLAERVLEGSREREHERYVHAISGVLLDEELS